MSDPNIKRASFTEIERMYERGELFHDPNSLEGAEMGPDFWAKATFEKPGRIQPVLLKLDGDVVDFFKSQGKGHLTRMQNVLRAYVKAHRHP